MHFKLHIITPSVIFTEYLMSTEYVMVKNNSVYDVFMNSQLMHTFTCYIDHDPLLSVFVSWLFMAVIKSYWITEFP